MLVSYTNVFFNLLSNLTEILHFFYMHVGPQDPVDSNFDGMILNGKGIAESVEIFNDISDNFNRPTSFFRSNWKPFARKRLEACCFMVNG